MFECGRCGNDFEKESNFNYHKENLGAKFIACVIFNGDLQTWVRCELCETKFRTESDLELHKMAVCEFHNVWTRCIECVKGLGCKAKYNRHWNRKHKLEWTETFPLKHLEKFEEASVNRKHNGNITLCKKPLIPTRPQMILIKALTEVRRVKKCFDRAVDDNSFLLKPDDIMVGYDRASMTRMISTSVRIGSLSLVNDDVVEVDLKMDLKVEKVL